jgi:2'-5' RNA ligase
VTFETFEAFVVETRMLLALDVAILLPPEVSQQAIELSASLPESESLGLQLGGEVLPHITLTQQFITADALEAVLQRVGSELTGIEPLRLTVTGAGRGRHSVWMSIQLTPPLADLHQRLMDALHPFERDGGTEAAFFDGAARRGDVEWVAGYRQTSSAAAFGPHITLGHAAALPDVELVTFEATTIAACHLGTFCTCRRVLRQWKLRAESQ